MENQSQFQPQGQPGSGKILAVVLALVVLIAAVLFYFFILSPKPITNPDNDNQQIEEFSVSTEQLSTAQIPTGFPQNIPMQTGNKVLQNYEAKSSDGRIQSVRKFSTSQTVQQALNTYTNFFESQRWVRLNSGNITSPVQMQLGRDTLRIQASNDSTSSQTIVELTLTQHPKE